MIRFLELLTIKIMRSIKKFIIGGLAFHLIFFSMDVQCQNNEASFPLPEVVDPDKHGKIPSDAIVLYNGGTLGQFESLDGTPAKWMVEGDHFTVKPGTGNIQTNEQFGSCQLHVEWKTPDDSADKEGQESGNSGIYLMGKYEIQVLNSFQNETYPDGQAGALYKQYPPLVNASRKPGEWQEYDIIFYAPDFNDEGIQIRSGYVTVFHNGILIHHNAQIMGPTTAYNKDLPEAASEGPLMLQDHSNEVSFRNIWIRKLK
jgi:hypothetical protein